MPRMCLDDEFVQFNVHAVRAPDGHLRWSQPIHSQHDKTCHTQRHMKHTLVVQFQALSKHFLKNAYFRCPKGTTRINKANIFNLCKRLILWGLVQYDCEMGLWDWVVWELLVATNLWFHNLLVGDLACGHCSLVAIRIAFFKLFKVSRMVIHNCWVVILDTFFVCMLPLLTTF